MTQTRRAWRLAPKFKRGIVIGSIALAIALLAYALIIRPDQNAQNYTHHLSNTSKPVEQCFEKLTDTTELSIFYAPDIALSEKQDDANTILRQIDICRLELNRFEAEAQQLIRMPLGNFTSSYRQAKVHQRQTFDVIGQSNDVLNQYHTMATFLVDYYAHIAAFISYTDQLRNSNQRYISNAQREVMEQQATDLRTRATQIRKLNAPREFADTKLQTANLFTDTASGLDDIATGIRYGKTETLEAGYTEVDHAVAAYDSTVINLPFEQLTKSYIPTQVDQLPIKIRNLLTVSSE